MGVGALALLRGAAVAAAVFALAVAPRLIDLGQYVTADEDLTLGRSASFAQAVATGDWRRTYQIGHPEVTVAWLTTFAVGAERLQPYDAALQRDDARSVSAQPGYLDVLVRARGLLAVVHAGFIALAALLAWRLWGLAASTLVGIMLALEPFLVAHGRILRTDGLLAELLLVALLAALAYWWRGAGAWALVLCTVATALALLTKTPAAILLVAVPAVALLGRTRPGWTLGAWVAGAAVVYVAVWPAMWVRPLQTLARVAEYTGEKGGSPMDAGAFFLGSTAPDPGPLFYVVALALRSSPLLLLGLALVGVALLGPALLRPTLLGLTAWLPACPAAIPARAAADRMQPGLLLLVAVLFAAAMMVLPKKSDRYILPVVPLLATLAALGLAGLVGRYGGRRRGLVLGGAAVLAVELAGLVAVWPYPLAYYDPLLGGGRAAATLMTVGWGEGLDRVARALDDTPDATTLTVATLYPEVLQAHFVGRAVPLEDADVADVLVTYVAATQRNLLPPPLAAAIAGREPELAVRINDISYAQVYRLARPSFGDGVTVGQVELRPPMVLRGRPVTVSVAWRGTGDLGANLEADVALLDESGRVAASSRSPLTARDGELTRYRLAAPSRWGKYTLAIGVWDPATGAYVPPMQRPIGSPDVTDRVVYRSATVRVQ